MADTELTLAEQVALLKETNDSLEREKLALIQEFAEAEGEDSPRAIRAKLVALTAAAVETIEHLMRFSDKDATRASLARYVCDVAMGERAMGQAMENEMAKLVESLSE